MGLKIRQNGTTYSLPYGDYTYRQTTHSLCYKKDGTVYYCPLCQENEAIYIDVGKEPYYVHYDKTIYPRIACKIAGEIYYAPNKLGKIASYSIPAGTYTPSAFRSLISQYISINGTRKCANAFTAKVNNQTISVSSGQTIAYKNCGTSPWRGTFVDFSGSTANVNGYSASNSFTGAKAYCVGLSDPSETGGGTGSYPNIFHSFASFSITIIIGINFQ